jgi:MFS family permease
MHKAIKVLILASIFLNFSVGLLAPIYAIFVERIGGNILSASFAGTIYQIIFGILIIIFGKIEDKLEKRILVSIGYLLNTMAYVIYYFVRNPLQLFFAQMILGVGDAVKVPAWQAIFSKSLDRGRESSEWAYWAGSTAIIYGVAALIGGVIATNYGFRFLFVLMALGTGVSTVISTFLFRKNLWKSFLNVKI